MSSDEDDGVDAGLAIAMSIAFFSVDAVIAEAPLGLDDRGGELLLAAAAAAAAALRPKGGFLLSAPPCCVAAADLLLPREEEGSPPLRVEGADDRSFPEADDGLPEEGDE